MKVLLFLVNDALIAVFSAAIMLLAIVAKRRWDARK